MAEEIVQEGTTEVVETSEVPEAPKREDKRLKSLSEKVELTSKERDTYKAEAEKASREASFYKDFNGMVSKYPQAAELQDKIREKVMGGYTVQDATAAVLVNEGRFQAPQAPRENPAGGSSVNQPPKVKSMSEMSQAERLEALKEAERAGQIWLS